MFSGVTLTINLVADRLIVQTADHRLMASDRPLPDDDTPKQFVASGKGWAAAICYAGVAQLRGRGSVSKILCEALEAAKASSSFLDVAGALADRASRWMAPATGERRLSITMAGITAGAGQGLTRIALVSNWQRLGEERDSMLLVESLLEAQNRFEVTDATVTAPVTVVSGWWPAVRDKDRIDLTRLVRRRRTIDELARATAHVNRVAAKRPEAKCTISSACTSIAVVVGPTQANGRSLAHADDGEREIVVPKVWCGFDLPGYMGKVVAEVWRQQGLPGVPQTVPSSTFVIGGPEPSGPSPYANTNDRFFL
jgi:hypothetical protein